MANTKTMYDVSFAGTRVIIGGVRIYDFMDDANPVDIQDTDNCNIEWSCNGKMIRTVKPAAVMVSVTVIPGSDSDQALYKIWHSGFSNTGNVNLGAADKEITCSISSPHAPKRSFAGGTCVSGAAGLTSNGQGKMGGNTYTFAFSQVN